MHPIYKEPAPAKRRFDAPHDIFKEDVPDTYAANVWKEVKDAPAGANVWKEVKDAPAGANRWKEVKDAPADANVWKKVKIEPADANVWKKVKDEPADVNVWKKVKDEPEASVKAVNTAAKPTATGPHRPLVQMLTELKRADEQVSGKWVRYCRLENHGSAQASESDGAVDPATCTDEFIQSFFTALQQNTIPNELTEDQLSSEFDQLFVTHLLPEFTEEDVRGYFETWGEVREITWKRLRNFCFVTMATSELTTKVLLNRHNIVIKKHRVIVRRAQNRRHPLDPSAPESVRLTTKWGQPFEQVAEEVPDISAATRIFVGHLPRGSVEDDLRRYFSAYGEIIRIEFTEKKGFGFVTFQEKEAVDEIIKWEENHAIGNQWVQCTRSGHRDGLSTKAKQKQRLDAERWKGSIFDEIKGQKGLMVKNMGERVQSELFLGALPRGCQTCHIEEAFKAFGEIAKIDLKISKGYAFISFTEPDTYLKVLQFNGHIQVANETIDVKRVKDKPYVKRCGEEAEASFQDSCAYDVNSRAALSSRQKNTDFDDDCSPSAKRQAGIPATWDLRVEMRYTRERSRERALASDRTTSSWNDRSWNSRSRDDRSMEPSSEWNRNENNWTMPVRPSATRQSAEPHWDTSAQKTDFTAFI